MAANDDISTDLAAEKRMPKCPGCKLPHNIHSFGDPGPYCTGTTGLPAADSASGLDSSAEQSNGGENNKSTLLSDPGAAKNPSVQPAEEPEEDEEAKLLAKLNELKVAEEAITKKRRVELLKTAIAQAEQCLPNLVDAPVVKPASGSNTLAHHVGWNAGGHKGY